MSKKKIVIVTIVTLIVFVGALIGWKLLSTKDYKDFEGTWVLKKKDFVDGDKLKGIKNNDKIDIDEKNIDDYDSGVLSSTTLVLTAEKTFQYKRLDINDKNFANYGSEDSPIIARLHNVEEKREGFFTIDGNSINLENSSGVIKSTNHDLIKEKSDFEITYLSDDIYSDDAEYEATYNRKGVTYLNTIEENKDKKRAFFRDDKLFILEQNKKSSGLSTKVMVFEKE